MVCFLTHSHSSAVSVFITLVVIKCWFSFILRIILAGFTLLLSDASGSVVGAVQGPAHAVEQMKEWLSRTGSPKSKITSAIFTGEVTITSPSYRDFAIRK